MGRNKWVVLEFNQQKLIANYKVRPYNYMHIIDPKGPARFQGGHEPNLDVENEYEERVTRTINNVLKCITAVYVPNQYVIQDLHPLLRSLAKVRNK